MCTLSLLHICVSGYVDNTYCYALFSIFVRDFMEILFFSVVYNI